MFGGRSNFVNMYWIITLGILVLSLCVVPLSARRFLARKFYNIFPSAIADRVIIYNGLAYLFFSIIVAYIFLLVVDDPSFLPLNDTFLSAVLGFILVPFFIWVLIFTTDPSLGLILFSTILVGSFLYSFVSAFLFKKFLTVPFRQAWKMALSFIGVSLINYLALSAVLGIIFIFI